jgi:NAD(P)-dependent dehydrogenase (short-subunit alcohol dehydrogenase family)
MSLTVLITGANRGIGLGLTTKFLREGHRVIATARNTGGSRELWELESMYGKSQCEILDLDVTDGASVKAAATALTSKAIDVMINNAGVMPQAGAPLSEIDMKEATKTLLVNAIGPLQTTQAFLPNIRKSSRKTVVTISSLMGSITDNTSGGAYAYRMSKSAANMFNKCLALEHPDVTAVALHPGWVQTDMGGAGATLKTHDSVNGLYQVIVGLKSEHSGRFFDYTGKELPW